MGLWDIFTYTLIRGDGSNYMKNRPLVTNVLIRSLWRDGVTIRDSMVRHAWKTFNQIQDLLPPSTEIKHISPFVFTRYPKHGNSLGKVNGRIVAPGWLCVMPSSKVKKHAKTVMLDFQQVTISVHSKLSHYHISHYHILMLFHSVIFGCTR